MLQKIYDKGSNLEQGAQPERQHDDAERTYTQPFRAAIDFYRLDTERRGPASTDAAAERPVLRRRGQGG